MEMVYNSPMQRIIFIFIDGAGVGRAEADNPFFAAASRYLPFWQGGMVLPDNTPLTAIDATLGIPGPPQSASGQTALFCGATAGEIGNRHVNGYPDRNLRAVILKMNLLSRLAGIGVRARYLNAYPAHDELFSTSHVRIQADGRLWFSAAFPEKFKRMISVTSCMLLASGQKPFGETDIRARRSLYQDYSNRQLITQGLDLPEYSPAQAAAIIAGAALEYKFVLYEYFQTDIYAHRRPFGECVELIRDLDILVGSLISRLDRELDTLVLTSDHGNLEEFHVRGHSRNPVPLLAWGRHGDQLRGKIRSLNDVTPALVQLFT
jgi:2,3-bisphosphoglycerate-independent phosphoglycerate mutase